MMRIQYSMCEIHKKYIIYYFRSLLYLLQVGISLCDLVFVSVSDLVRNLIPAGSVNARQCEIVPVSWSSKTFLRFI